jgi:hypothetical protein
LIFVPLEEFGHGALGQLEAALQLVGRCAPSYLAPGLDHEQELVPSGRKTVATRDLFASSVEEPQARAQRGSGLVGISATCGWFSTGRFRLHEFLKRFALRK